MGTAGVISSFVLTRIISWTVSAIDESVLLSTGDMDSISILLPQMGTRRLDRSEKRFRISGWDRKIAERTDRNDTAVLGVSIDSPFANAEFAEQLGVQFPLLSDMTRKVSKEYGVLNDEKQLHGAQKEADSVTEPAQYTGKTSAACAARSITKRALKNLQIQISSLLRVDERGSTARAQSEVGNHLFRLRGWDRGLRACFHVETANQLEPQEAGTAAKEDASNLL